MAYTVVGTASARVVLAGRAAGKSRISRAASADTLPVTHGRGTWRRRRMRLIKR